MRNGEPGTQNPAREAEVAARPRARAGRPGSVMRHAMCLAMLVAGCAADGTRNPEPGNQKPAEHVPAGARPYFGAMPDYGQPDKMVVSEVAPGSPADKAGLKPGDEVTSLNGEKIKDLQHYSDRLFACRPNQPVELAVERAGKALTVKGKMGWKVRGE